MPTLDFSGTLSFGDSTTEGAVPCRIPLTYTLTYTEESSKTVQIAAGQTDFAVDLDTVGTPRFILIRSLETDVDISLSDGVTADPTPTALAEGEGWVMLVNPNGQAINQFLVTTPASPTTGARVNFIAFE